MAGAKEARPLPLDRRDCLRWLRTLVMNKKLVRVLASMSLQLSGNLEERLKRRKNVSGMVSQSGC